MYLGNCPLGYKRENKKMIIDETTKDLVIRIFNMYLEGKSYQTIANILNAEKITTLTNKQWKDATVSKIINNKIYIGDFEQYRNKQEKETIVYMNVVDPIISRAMYEDVQAQKEKNQRAFCRDRIYIFMQKLLCPKCGKIMQCKGSGGQKKKYMYYHCSDCKTYLREDLVEDSVMFLIMNLIEYDMTVKKYFFPILADKKERNTDKLDKEIANLQSQKNRIKEAYLKGIVEVEDFSEDYRVIEEKLNMLEEKRIQAIDINKQSFSPQSIMVDRDVEKEKLIRSNKFQDMLMAEWKSKTKEEKQEFISKFVENIVIEKDKKGYYNLINIKFRSSYIEQFSKLMDLGMFDIALPFEQGKKERIVNTTVLMDKKELKAYMDRLNEYYEVSYYELNQLDKPKKGYQKKYLTIEEVNRNGEQLFKLVELISDDKQFPQKEENRILGEIRIKEREKVS